MPISFPPLSSPLSPSLLPILDDPINLILKSIMVKKFLVFNTFTESCRLMIPHGENRLFPTRRARPARSHLTGYAWVTLSTVTKLA